MNLLKKLGLGFLTTQKQDQNALVPTRSRALRGQYPPEPVIIPGDYEEVHEYNAMDVLAWYLDTGRAYHELCRGAFVDKTRHGYWAYEQYTTYRTCAIAAAYAGAFGPKSIERPDFSYSMAIWRLSRSLGVHLGTYQVTGPTGRDSTLAKEMIFLIDKDYWTRAGVAEWIRTL